MASSSISPTLSTAAFASRIFIAQRHGNRLVHKIVMTQRIALLLSNVILMIFCRVSLECAFWWIREPRTYMRKQFCFSLCGLCERPLPARAHRECSLAGSSAPLRMNSLGAFIRIFHLLLHMHQNGNVSTAAPVSSFLFTHSNRFGLPMAPRSEHPSESDLSKLSLV